MCIWVYVPRYIDFRKLYGKFTHLHKVVVTEQYSHEPS